MADNTEFETPKPKVPSILNYASLGTRRRISANLADRWRVSTDRRKPLEQRMAELTPNSKGFKPRMQALINDIVKHQVADVEGLEKDSVQYEENKRNTELFLKQMRKILEDYNKTHFNFTEAEFEDMLYDSKKKHGLFGLSEEDKFLEERVLLKREVDQQMYQFNKNVKFQEYLRDLDKAVQVNDTTAQQELLQKMEQHELIGGNKQKLRVVIDNMHKDRTNDIVTDKFHKTVSNLLGAKKV